MAIDYPVIYTDFNSHPVVFILRPSHIPMFIYDQFELSARQIIEVPEVHDLFKKTGKVDRVNQSFGVN